MAHELELIKGKASMVWNVKGGTPWHGLGTPIDGKEKDMGKIIEMINGGYEVKRKRLHTPEGVPVDAYYFYREVPGDVEGTTKEQIFAQHVGPGMTILQNETVGKWFQPMLDLGLVEVESAGILRNGARIWVLARILDKCEAEVVPGDSVRRYIMLSNSHDGTQCVRAGFTGIRVVCANTLADAFNDRQSSSLLRIKHTKNINEALQLARTSMDLAEKRFVTSVEVYRRMADCGVNEEDLKQYVTQVFSPPKQLAVENAVADLILAAGETVSDVKALEEDIKKTGKRVFPIIQRLFESGRGTDIKAVRGTLWAAYNAITEYIDHERGNGTQAERFESAQWKEGASMRSRALHIAMKWLKSGKGAEPDSSPLDSSVCYFIF